ncbi:Rho_N domain-containing protein [Cephalotus follicularis]|uniref:Rho_N domain-containing protein n=1 Tax=Cephalotus follicularis TaxID=3775 RepID=A0A1Q3DAL3_CEPFO|nr:Rho_N domain-containing protein [Cephalotus follicularis]
MDIDIWDSSYSEAPTESSYYMQSVWQCDFYCGHGFDIIDENALNEKYCKQVLTILMTKADTEIDELEKDLVWLQSEIAWVECEEWSEICCNALQTKIDHLDVLIMNLRNKDKNDIEVHLLMHDEPVERIHEIVEALVRNYLLGKVQQPADAIVLDSSSKAPGLAAEALGKNIKLSDIVDSIVKEEIKGSTTKNGGISLELQKKKTNKPVTVEIANTKVEDSSFRSLTTETCHSDEKEALSNFDLKCTVAGEAKEYGFSSSDKEMIQISSLKYEDMKRYNLDMVKIQPADIILNNSHTDALRPEIGHSKKKKSRKSDSKTSSEEVEEHSSTSTGVNSIESMTSLEKRANLGKSFKPQYNIVIDSSTSACGCSNEVKMSSKSTQKVRRNQEVEECFITAADKNNIFKSSMNPESKVNLPNAERPATVLKNVSPAELRHATGLNGNRNDCDTGLGASIQARSDKCDMDQKLCEFSLKASRKRSVKQSKISPIVKIQSSVSFEIANGKRKKSPQIMMGGEAGLTDTENSALASLLELQDNRGEETTKQQPEQEGKFQLGESQIDKVTASEKMPNLNLLNPERQNVDIKPNSPIVQEPGNSYMQMVLKSSSISNAKRQQKSGIGSFIARLSKSSNSKITENSVQPQSESKMHCVASDGNQISYSQLQKKQKSFVSRISMDIKSPTVAMDVSKLPRDPTNHANEVLCITKSSIDGSCAELVASLPLDKISLKNMTMPNLKAIAKQHKLLNFRKLRKDALVELLANQLGCC